MCAQNAETFPTDDTLSPSEFIKDNNEPVDPREKLHGELLTWGATPLIINARQLDVFRLLSKRINRSAPESTPDDVKKFVSQHFMSRFFERQDRNAKSLDDRNPDIKIDNLDDETQDILAAAILGVSNPKDLLELRETLGMPSIELARLTHPYGKHMKTLGEMRQSIDFAIESNGGRLIEDDSMTTYGVDGGHIRDKGENIELGFLMKRKRVRGILPDGTVVIERSTFVLRVDKESSLNQDIAQQFRDIKIDKNPDWNKQVMEQINANNLIPGLLEDNEFDIAIPLSTTTYAYNPRLDYELEQTKKIKCVPEGPTPEWLVKAREQEKERAAGAAALKALNPNRPTRSR